MCPPKPPKIVQPDNPEVAAPIPDPAPPMEETATEVVTDTGDRNREGRRKTRRGVSDLRINLNIPGVNGRGGNGLNV